MKTECYQVVVVPEDNESFRMFFKTAAEQLAYVKSVSGMKGQVFPSFGRAQFLSKGPLKRLMGPDDAVQSLFDEEHAEIDPACFLE